MSFGILSWLSSGMSWGKHTESLSEKSNTAPKDNAHSDPESLVNRVKVASREPLVEIPCETLKRVVLEKGDTDKKLTGHNVDILKVIDERGKKPKTTYQYYTWDDLNAYDNVDGLYRDIASGTEHGTFRIRDIDKKKSTYIQKETGWLQSGYKKVSREAAIKGIKEREASRKWWRKVYAVGIAGLLGAPAAVGIGKTLGKAQESIASPGTNIIKNAAIAYGITTISGHREAAGSTALFTTLVSLFGNVQAAAPTVKTPLQDQTAEVGQKFSYPFKWSEVFEDTDGDHLSITATLDDGSPLPDWLKLTTLDYSYLDHRYSTPSNCGSVTVEGGKAYVGVTNTMEIFNLSDPLRPSLLVSFGLPFGVFQIDVIGEVAYVSTGSGGVIIINVTNPVSPVLLGSYTTNGTISDVAVVGNTAYVALVYTTGEDFVVLNVTEPSTPTYLGGYDTGPWGCERVEVIGTLAYVQCIDGFHILDVTNSSAPLFLSRLSGSSHYGIKVVGSVVYMSDGLLFKIIDVSNSVNPRLLGELSVLDEARGMEIVGNRAYLADSGAGLSVIDISNSSSPILLGRYDTFGFARDLAVMGDYVYIADAVFMQVIDLSANPLDIYPKGNEGVYLGRYTSGGFGYDVETVGTRAYLADDNHGLAIINVANLQSPTLLSEFDTIGDALSVQVIGNIAYITADDQGFQIVDVSNPLLPFLVGNFTTPGPARGIYVSSEIAYLANEEFDFQIVNISNPIAPSLLSTFDTGGRAYDVVVQGSTAYIANGGSGLLIMDVTDPFSPRYLGSYNPGWTLSVTVDGTVAYVAAAESGLQIIDVSNPAAPVPLGGYDTFGNAWSVEIKGKTAYVVDLWAGLKVFDISNTSNPIFVGTIDTMGGQIFSLAKDGARKVKVIGSTAYVADGSDNGLGILDISPRTFYGTPAAPGIVIINVSADDGSGGKVSDQFQISVAPPSTVRSRSSLSTTLTESEAPSVPGKASPNLPLIVGLSAGVMGGTTIIVLFFTCVYIPRRRKAKERTENKGGRVNSIVLSPIESDSESSGKVNDIEDPEVKPRKDTFKMEPVTVRHARIGEKYLQMSKISAEEAKEVTLASGLVIPFPVGQKKFKFVIGKGNFGAIKVAQSLKNGEYVASKKVKGTINVAESKAEAGMQRAAEGKNVLPIYNTIELEEHGEQKLYHFMPLAGLGNTRAIQGMLSTKDRRLREQVLTYVAKDLLTGLQTMHAKNIFHLDIKPENIVFTKDGTGYVTDFGCAKQNETGNPTIDHKAIGDNRYFPPERYRAVMEKGGFEGDKADVWAAGLMLLELATGKDLNKFQVLGIPSSVTDRFKNCNEAFFAEKLDSITELKEAREGSIYWVIKEMLVPDSRNRINVKAALSAECFKRLDSEKKEAVFETLKENTNADEGIEEGKSEEVVYRFTPSNNPYDSKEHKQYYTQSGEEGLLGAGNRASRLPSEYV